MSLFATHSELILSLAKLTSALLIAFAVDPFLKRSALRATFWAGVLLILPTVILATHGRSSVNILPQPSAAERVETGPAVMFPAPAAPVVIPSTQLLAATPSEKTLSQKMPEVQESRTNWVAVVFFTGLVLSFLPTLLSLFRIGLTPKRPVNRDTMVLWESIRPQGMETVPLYVTRSPSAPFTAGLVRAAILLPESSVAWSPRRLRSTLYHEAAHIARRDILVRMAVNLVRAVLWFHPLVWLAHRKLVAAQEEACDESALSAGIPPDEYAEDLLETAKHPQFAFAHALHMARWSQLGSRIQTILHYKQTTHQPISMKKIATAILGITIVTYGLSTFGFSETPGVPEAPAPSAQTPKPAKPEEAEEKPEALEARKVELETQIRNLGKLESPQLYAYASQIDVPDNSVKTIYPRYLESARDLKELQSSGFGERHPTLLSIEQMLTGLISDLDKGVGELKASREMELRILVKEFGQVERGTMKSEGKISKNSTVLIQITGVTIEEKQRTDGTYLVSKDGIVILPYIGRVEAADKTAGDLASEIQKAYRDQKIYSGAQIQVIAGN